MNKIKEKIENIENRISELEELAISKLEKEDISPNLLNLDEADLSVLKSKIVEQDKIIQNLSEELNQANKTIKDIGRENDFLKDKNRFFADKIFKFKSQGTKIILSVEQEIETVREIIKNKLK